MKKRKNVAALSITVAAVLLFLSGACSRRREIISGELLPSDEKIRQEGFYLLKTGADQSYAVQTDENTQLASLAEGLTTADLKSGKSLKLTAEGTKSRKRYKTGDAGDYPVFRADSLLIDGIYLHHALQLADGTPVTKIQSVFTDGYSLDDGTVLLRENRETVFANDETIGKFLKPEAAAAAKTYFQKRAPFYDLEAELNRAYSRYREAGDDERFEDYLLEENLMIAAEAEDYLYFITEIALPSEHDASEHQAFYSGTVIRKDDGSCAGPAELFDFPEENFNESILSYFEIEEEAQADALTKALRPEYFIFYPERLELCFPPGSLPFSESSYSAAAEYEDGLASHMRAEALPRD